MSIQTFTAALHDYTAIGFVCSCSGVEVNASRHSAINTLAFAVTCSFYFYDPQSAIHKLKINVQRTLDLQEQQGYLQQLTTVCHKHVISGSRSRFCRWLFRLVVFLSVISNPQILFSPTVTIHLLLFLSGKYSKFFQTSLSRFRPVRRCFNVAISNQRDAHSNLNKHNRKYSRPTKELGFSREMV